MMTAWIRIHLAFPEETARLLREQAREAGMPMSRYVSALILREEEDGRFLSRTAATVRRVSRRLAR